MKMIDLAIVFSSILFVILCGWSLRYKLLSTNSIMNSRINQIGDKVVRDSFECSLLEADKDNPNQSIIGNNFFSEYRYSLINQYATEMAYVLYNDSSNYYVNKVLTDIDLAFLIWNNTIYIYDNGEFDEMVDISTYADEIKDRSNFRLLYDEEVRNVIEKKINHTINLHNISNNSFIIIYSSYKGRYIGKSYKYRAFSAAKAIES